MQARALGALLAERSIRLVYGGARVGVMGALADAALASGGDVVGVMPQLLWDREVGHDALGAMHVVETMHQRKAKMAELSDAFISLPGGIGTLEELFEVWTWGQLGIHDKPYGLLDVNGYWQPMLGFLAHAVTEGFIRPAYLESLVVEQEPGALLDRLVGQ